MRRWLGNKGTGWPRLLLNALVALLAVLAVLFGLSFGGTFGWFSALPLVAQLALSIGTVGAMALAPWGIIAALHRWRRAAEREARED